LPDYNSKRSIAVDRVSENAKVSKRLPFHLAKNLCPHT
jgi:hypothetical protein